MDMIGEDSVTLATAQTRGTNRIRVRGRGSRLMVCRWAGLCLTVPIVVGYVLGSLGTVAIVILFALIVIDQVWLIRPGIVVDPDKDVVVLRGLVRTDEYPLADVTAFGVSYKPLPLDSMSHEVVVVVHLSDGSTVEWPWVGWGDRISPLLVQAERPLRPSQKRVLNRLNGALALATRYRQQAYGPDGGVSGTALMCPGDSPSADHLLTEFTLQELAVRVAG